MKNLSTIYLGLGTNLGNKEQNLRRALCLIEKRIGSVISLSAFYATAPWGFSSANSFLNAAAAVETTRSPLEVLSITQSIELELGRTQKSSDRAYSDRPIDIDLLLFDTLVFSTRELTLPHPLMHERSFVMTPLAEIAPTVIHPVLRCTLKEISDRLGSNF